jgi:signal transduction histidine kinase
LLNSEEELMVRGKVLAAMLVMLFIATTSFAGTCTKGDLVKAVDYAADLINTKGKAALPELKKFKFCGDVGYVFVNEMNGKNLMHPIQKLEGGDMSTLQGAKGEYFGAEMKAKAEKYGEGWISYTWQNTVTKKVESKCAYIKTATLDGKKVFVGGGIFGLSAGECK